MTVRAPSIGMALLGAALAFSSCRSSRYYIDYPLNPIDGVHAIAVAPVPGPTAVDSYAVGDALAAELIQCGGIERVIRPSDFERVAREHEISLTNASSVRTMARILGVDGVLVAEISEYNPYHPPRIGIVARLFIAGSVQQSRATIVDISRRGNVAPVENAIAADLIKIEKVYDASHRDVYHQAKWYAFGHDFDTLAMGGGERVVWLEDLYIRFVSFNVVGDLFKEYALRLRESKRKKSI